MQACRSPVRRVGGSHIPGNVALLRRAVLAVLLLSAPSAAFAGEAPAPACRLAPADCAVVLHELAVDAELFAQDREIVGLGLSPQDRARALIRRDDDRMAVRFRLLPAPIAAEIARVRACQEFEDAGGPPAGAPPDRTCP